MLDLQRLGAETPGACRRAHLNNAGAGLMPTGTQPMARSEQRTRTVPPAPRPRRRRSAPSVSRVRGKGVAAIATASVRSGGVAGACCKETSPSLPGHPDPRGLAPARRILARPAAPARVCRP